MKIIEILNLIAEDKVDKIPQRISYNNVEYDFVKSEKDYLSEDKNWLFDEYAISTILNEYVGILVKINSYRSFQDKKIKELNVCDYIDNDIGLIEGMVIKINELIGEINKIKEKINE